MTKHRLLACLLALCLLLGCVPAGLAEGDSGSSSDLVQLIREKLIQQKNEEAAAQEEPAADASSETAPAQEGETAPEAVAGLPVFIAQPKDRQVQPGKLTVMEADVEDADSYQWQYSVDQGANWVDCGKDFTGPKTTRVLFAAKESMNGWLFRLAATNQAGTAYSREAVLTVGEAKAPAEEPAAEEPAAEEPAVEEPEEDELSVVEPIADLSDPFAQTEEVEEFITADANPRLTPATITLQPTDVTKKAGDTAAFFITATGSGTLTYQWQYSWDNMEPWKNLTNGSFWIGNKTDSLKFQMKDTYDNMYVRCAVTLTSDGSSVTVFSKGAQVKLGTGPVITFQPADLTLSKDQLGFFQTAASGSGTVKYQWQYRKSETDTETNMTDGADWSDTTKAVVRVYGRIGFDGYQFRCAVTDDFGTEYTDWATLHIKEAATPEIIVQPGPADITCFVDDELTIDLVAINATKYQWQYSKDNGATWSNLSNGSYWKGNKTDTLTFLVAASHDGMMIRCKVSNDVPVSVDSDAVTLHVMQAPVIVTDPTDQSVTSGDPVTFSITATGATKYQWQCSSNGGITWVNLTNGSFWKGNKTDTLTFTTMDRHDGYLFRCLAINDAGTTASAAAKLTLAMGISIKQQPKDQVAGEGTTATFTVVAENADTYQWEMAPIGTTTYSNVPTSWTGYNTDTLIVPAELVWTAYQYRCKVSNSVTGAYVYTTAAKLSLLALPNILQDPTDVCVNIGQKATFAITATGATSYQWQYSTDGVSWGNLTNGSYWVGNHASNLSFKAAANYNNFYFRCAVSNAAGTTYSAPAKLCIMGMPVIVTQPISRNVPVNATVAMEVIATGATSYAWQYHNGVKWVTLNNTAIWQGANTNRLVFQAKKYMNGYQFRCMVKNGSGTVYSDAALLTVSAVIPPQPNNVNITGAGMSILTVSWSKVVADELNGYKIYYSKSSDPATATLAGIVDPTQKSFTIIGLDPMTNYYVWVSAYNTAGESGLNSHVMATGKTMWANTDMIPPEAPSNVKATVLGDSSVKLTWTKSPSPGVIGYMIYYSTQSLASNAKLHQIVADANKTSAIMTDLKPGTRYYIWVVAYDDGGISLMDNYVRAVVTTTGNPAYPIVPVVSGDLPDPPLNVAARRLSNTSAQVTWKRGTSTDLTGFSIYYGITSDPSASTLYAKTGPEARNITVNTLNANFGYYFWVVSVNEVGECEMTADNRAYADVMNPIVVVYPPLQPLTVAASAVSKSKITVYWTSSPSPDVEGYRLYYNTVNNPNSAVAYAEVRDPSATSMTIFGLKAVTKYYVWVAAFNDAGESKLDANVSSSAYTLYY